MNIKLEYTIRSKTTPFHCSGEVYVHITKKEARFIARRHFIWERTIQKLDCPFDYDAIAIVLRRGAEKTRKMIYERLALRRDEYDLEIEISDDQEELFTNEVIKDYFKFLLSESIQEKNVMYCGHPVAFVEGCTIYNTPVLSDLYHDSVDFFQEYYSGDLTRDALNIQRRIIRQHEQGMI